MASFSAVRGDVIDRVERRRHYTNYVLGLNAYDRHKKFMHDFVLHYNKSSSTSKEKRPIKTDQDTLRETYRFIRTEEDDSENTWEQRLAKRYYDKLFKEYCISDMTHYKDGKIGLRWRTEKELISGKGQFICGNKMCDMQEELSSYEVNFTYKEAGESKQALVKLRVCPGCAEKLNYRKENERKSMPRHEHHDPVEVGDEDEDGDGDDDNDRLKSEYKEKPGSSKRRRIPDSRHRSGDGDDDGQDRGVLSSDRRKKKTQQRSDDEEYDKYFEGMFL